MVLAGLLREVEESAGVGHALCDFALPVLQARHGCLREHIGEAARLYVHHRRVRVFASIRHVGGGEWRQPHMLGCIGTGGTGWRLEQHASRVDRSLQLPSGAGSLLMARSARLFFHPDGRRVRIAEANNLRDSRQRFHVLIRIVHQVGLLQCARHPPLRAERVEHLDSRPWKLKRVDDSHRVFASDIGYVVRERAEVRRQEEVLVDVYGKRPGVARTLYLVQVEVEVDARI